ncbi:MAG: siroheme synthase CysG [Methylophilaceae bacterium]|jgi:uroporphyrin-III C-methyltransferase / precorrin-2 dehydrogenase / sirohydrochlorin ferrochelatase|nr:siroheme synthase CysG [Methylophilaceae bacterium]
MENFPIFIDIGSKPVIVVGGGTIALRKVILLSKANPKITVISENICLELRELLKKHRGKFIKKSFSEKDIKNPILIIAATNNIKVNKEIYRVANKRNIPINVVDQPKLCSFTMGSIIERDALVIAITSGGKAPVLARILREKIEAFIPASYAGLVNYVGDLRKLVKKNIRSGNKRRIFWENFFESNFIDKFNSKKNNPSKKVFTNLIKKQNSMNYGEVFLVGAGPGERDLLTLRALHLMQKCDVCIYDNLVSDDILELVRRDAEMVYAGKKRDQHTIPQDKINKFLVAYAKQGKRVLRLKGGDPFIFGRGGEEIESLMKNKIAFQVVPGISAANGISSYAGIPLTHRDHAQSCLFLTGHFKEGAIDFDWPKLIVEKQTLVVYMGLLSLGDLIRNLTIHGMLKEMPIAVIENGTTANQKVVVGTLRNIRSKVSRTRIKSPALIIIGTVVNLRDQLNWFN